MSDPRDETPEITPQVIHLIDLLKRAREGRLRVPKFQREFVWRRQDIADLFDSIARQYPIGTLFLWGAQPVPRSRQNIGPLLLPDYKGETWLVLDGQQRLTTLVGVLLAGEPGWSDGDDADPGRWALYYDAQENAFSHAKKDEKLQSNFPVTVLLDTVKFFNYASGLFRTAESSGQAKDAMRENVSRWVNRAQEVARAIQSYRIPLVEIKTNNLSIAVESFSRLNKKGRSIGQDEMFSALTYEEGSTDAFHLAAEIDKLQLDMVRSGFGEVDRTILLRAVLTAAGLDMYRTDWTSLGDKVKQDVRHQLPQAVKEAAHGLVCARRFLSDELRILNARMLPYSMQLVALSAFFGRCPSPTDEQKALLKRWFWSSSFAGWFGSGNPARVRRLVDEFRDKLSKNPAPTTLEFMEINQPALPIPLRFDLRSARVRALVCLLLARGPQRADGKTIHLEEAARMLLERGPESMTTLCATVVDRDLRRSPANRVFDVQPGVSGQAKNWILDLVPALRDQVLISHGIDPAGYALLKSGENDKFLRQRIAYLSSIEREFMQQVHVTPPLSDQPSPAPIDTDDIEGFGEDVSDAG